MQAQAFHPWQLGELLCGQYRLVEILGQSPHCITYRAIHEGWQDAVRVRAFGGSHSTSHLVEQVKNWQRLPLHPLFANGYYLRSVQGRPILVSDYLAGTSLDDWIVQQDLRHVRTAKTLQKLFDIVIQTAWGLSAAHHLGVTYGNLELSNIILTPQGNVCLTDWLAPTSTTLATDHQDWLQLLRTLAGTLSAWPRALSPHLKRWEAQSELVLADCVQVLCSLYQEQFEQPYPQVQPELETWRTSTLNNRALALVDLGETSGAIALWEQAQQDDPNHPESLYNFGLWQWRSHQLETSQLLAQLAPLAPQMNHWLGYIHLEAGDGSAAIAAFEQWRPYPGQSVQTVKQAKTLAQQRLEQQSYRTLVPQLTHAITAIAYSADGRSAVWGDTNGGIAVWDLQLHKGLALPGHQQARIAAIALSADSTHLISIGCAHADDSATLKLWSFRTGKCLAIFPQLQDWQTLDPDVPPQYYRWSADGRYCLYRSEALLTLVEKATGNILYAIQADLTPITLLPKTTEGLSFAPHAPSTTVVLWDLGTHTPLRSLPVPRGGCAIATLAHHGAYFVSDRQGNLTQHALTDGRILAQWSLSCSSLTQFQVSRDGQRVLLQGDSLSLWDLTTGQCLQSLSLPEPHCLTALNPIRSTILIAGQQLQLWQVPDAHWQYHAPWQRATPQTRPAQVLGIDSQTRYLQQAHQAWQTQDLNQTYTALQQLQNLPPGELRDRTFALWSQLYTHLPRQRLRSAWPVHTFAAHVNAIEKVCFGRDGSILTCSGNGTVKRWLIHPERVLGTIIGHPRGWLHGFAISPDQQWLVTSSRRDGLQTWQIRTGKLHSTLTQGGDTALSAIAWLPDSPYLLGGTEDGTLQIWHMEQKDCLHSWQAHAQTVTTLCVSPDGHYAVSAEAAGIWKRWELATGECLQMITSAQAVITDLVYSPDGQYLLTAAQDSALFVWDVATGKRLRTLRGHRGAITTVAMTQDSRYVLSGSEGGDVKFWDVRTGACLETWSFPNTLITTVAVSRTSQYIVIGTQSGDAHLFALDWQLAPPLKPRWDETARPYLNAFLKRKTPQQALPQQVKRRLSLPQQLRELPVGVLALWTVLTWLGLTTGDAIWQQASQPLGISLYAGGAALFIWSYFTSRQWGNPSLQLGSLFGVVVLALVGMVDLRQDWATLGAVAWGAIAALCTVGPVLGLWHPAPATRPLGLRTCQSLKHYWGNGGAIALLVLTLTLGIGIELVLVALELPRWSPLLFAALVVGLGQMGAYWRWGWRPLRLLRSLSLLGLIALTSFTWFLPSRLGAVPQPACASLWELQDYLQRGGSPNGEFLDPAQGALLDCALTDGNTAFLTTLIEHEAQLDRLNRRGDGILHLAVQQQNAETIALLLEAGSPVNLRDSLGRTPLHYAPTGAIADRLIAAGAAINPVAPLDGTPLQRATRYGRLEVVKRLLHHDANLNRFCQGEDCEDPSPVYSAIHYNRWDILEVLLQHEVDLTVRDDNEQSPLEYAQSLNKTQAIALLQQYLEPEF